MQVTRLRIVGISRDRQSFGTVEELNLQKVADFLIRRGALQYPPSETLIAVIAGQMIQQHQQGSVWSSPVMTAHELECPGCHFTM